MDVFKEIKEILRQQLNVQAHTINVNTDIFQDLSADSLDAVEIIMHCEETFKISISEVDVQDLYTVGDLVSYINNRLGIEKVGWSKFRRNRIQITESGEIFEK
jgi:acyl carrier protein